MFRPSGHYVMSLIICVLFLYIPLQVMESLTESIVLVVNDDLLGKRKGDKYLSSIITNCFTNLAAKDQFANYETTVCTSGRIHTTIVKHVNYQLNCNT